MSIENVVKLWHVVSFSSLFRRFRPKVTSHVQGRWNQEGEGKGSNWPLARFWQLTLDIIKTLTFQKALKYYLLPPLWILRPSHVPEICLPRGTRSNSRPRKTEIYLLYLDKQLYHIGIYKRHM